MSPRWPRVPAKRLVALLKRLGYEEVRQRGSHLKLRKIVKGRRHTIVIAVHSGRDLPPGYVGDVLKDVARRHEIPVEDLINQL